MASDHTTRDVGEDAGADGERYTHLLANSALHATPGNHQNSGALLILCGWLTTEFASPDDKCFVEQAALLEIG